VKSTETEKYEFEETCPYLYSTLSVIGLKMFFFTVMGEINSASDVCRCLRWGCVRCKMRALFQREMKPL